AADVRHIKEQLVEMESRGEVRLSDFVRAASGGDLVERALRAFAGYHTTPVLVSRREGIAMQDPSLLFYYQNRLASHGVAWDVLGGSSGGAGRPLPPVNAPAPSVAGAR
ncbi:MAG: hypothetical protein HOV80_14300, partial [Polyangiaceae bacterium]|nr:hypothetical protein [Polyangiaceae bacterium]